MKINEDIKIERKNCTFDVEEFTRWYYQGDEKLEEKRFLGKVWSEHFNLYCCEIVFIHIRKLFFEWSWIGG